MADKKQEEKDSPESKEIARLEAALKEAHKARKDAESERDAAKQLLEEVTEEIRVRPMLPGAEKGKPLFFALCRIHHSGSVIEPGQLLPFDPTDPPPYCNGFVEGEHYRKG
jgi:hypothetical protein